MGKQCLNCGYQVNENFCPNCGQSTSVDEITWKSFAAELIKTHTNIERSIVGTTWQLWKNPGRTLDEYIRGKRKKYYSPIGYFLIMLALSVIFQQLVIAKIGFHPVVREGITFDNPESIRVFIKYGTWIYFVTFPFSAAIFYFILARSTYSYLESLVITVYAFSFAYVIFIFCNITGGLILSLNVFHWKFFIVQISIANAYTIWACFDLFRNKSKKFLWFRIGVYIIINFIVVLQLLKTMSDGWVWLEKYFS